jgi:hypothetical protein
VSHKLKILTMVSIISYLGDKTTPQLRKEVEESLGEETVKNGIKSGFVSVSKSEKIHLSKKGVDRYIAMEGQRMMRRMLF